jgi:hypothetical protein
MSTSVANVVQTSLNGCLLFWCENVVIITFVLNATVLVPPFPTAFGSEYSLPVPGKIQQGNVPLFTFS